MPDNCKILVLRIVTRSYFSQSAVAVEYAESHFCRVVIRLNECPRYDTKQYDGEVPVMLELWGMQSTPSLPLLPGPLWPGVVAPDQVLSMGLNRTKSWF